MAWLKFSNSSLFRTSMFHSCGHRLFQFLINLNNRKTCGFLLPVFHKFQQDNPNPFAGRSAGRGFGRGGHGGRGRPPMGGGGPPRKPILLVLAPTRELSVQILEEAQKFGRPLGVSSVCCYGGSSKYPQIAALERGVDCIIATPGRLNDLIEMKKADLSGIQFLVLDEADRMLDMVRKKCESRSVYYRPHTRLWLVA